jgi:molybdate transport system ATP-binding protein
MDDSTVPELPEPPSQSKESFDTLVRMRNCKVQYGEIMQFQNFNWELKPGEHTLITGPNGAGKSTLLQLISGDHPQCYSNDIQIFGYQRGSGESIWDIKKHIGIVSASLHRDYRAPGNALTTVVSGLYDSIGLYQQPTQAQKQLAMQWLEIMGLSALANTGFRQLSWGQQRLVLIARGLIKLPPLLILDEPTQGLDDLNRHLVLSFIRKLTHIKRTTLLFVSHRQDEHLALFTHKVHFTACRNKSALYEISWVPTG